MPDRIVVVGAGIAGLGAAMALARGDREVVVVDRDPPPPPNLETAFDTWERKGVTQLRHSHVFLGCLVTLIREKHPRLREMLEKAGARELDFEASLPHVLRGKYTPADGDRDLSFLFSRRTTLEHTIRAYVETLPGVRFLTGTIVRDLILDQTTPTPTVRGVRIERDGAPAEDLTGDTIIDAGGRTTIFTDWLRERGITIEEEKSPAGILYFTRHYRIRDGQTEPPRDLIPGAGDLGYIKYGVFAADNRHFSITLAVPEIESELRVATLSPTTFDAICNQIPGVARWIDPARAEPVTKVFGMGNLHSVWRHFVKKGEPVVLNYFAVGDSAIRTNPLYGRGCSQAVLHAHILGDVMAQTTNARERAIAFDKRSHKELRPFWNALMKQDLGAIRRAKNEQNPAYKPRFKARLIKSFAEDAIGPATRSDMSVYRAIMRGFHMLAMPTAWLVNPYVVWRVLTTWAKPKTKKLYPPKLGPGRNEMLAAIGLKTA